MSLIYDRDSISGPARGAFVVGDRFRAYYTGAGTGDDALITDFDPREDRLQVYADLDYEFQIITADTDSDLPAGIGVFANGELIAILQDLEVLEEKENIFMIPV